jgi:hypothetical protein
VTRVLQQGSFDYWESGMDLHLGDDMYESFVEYQKRIMGRFDKMVEDYGFRVIDASRSIDEIFTDLKGQMSQVLSANHEAASDSIARLKPARNGRATLEIPRNERRESNLHYVSYKPAENHAVELPRNEPGPLVRS